MISKKKLYTKSIALCAVLFFVPLCCMDKPIASPFLPKDIIDARITPRLSLQKMSRFSRTCKIYSKIINLRDISPEDSVCDYLKVLPYDTLTRLLGHCEITKNKKMFDFVRSWHAEIRDQDETVFRESYEKGWKKVRSYKKMATVEALQKQRVRGLVELYRPYKTAAELLKIVLQGSNFNILDGAAKEYCEKKSKGLMGYPCYKLKRIIFYICCYDDPDLWLAVLGGAIEPRAFKYVSYYASNDVIKELHKRDVFIEGVDEKGWDLNDYFRWRETPQADKERARLAREKHSYWNPQTGKQL